MDITSKGTHSPEVNGAELDIHVTDGAASSKSRGCVSESAACDQDTELRTGNSAVPYTQASHKTHSQHDQSCDKTAMVPTNGTSYESVLTDVESCEDSATGVESTLSEQSDQASKSILNTFDFFGQELKLKDEQCRKLEQVQIQMGKELEDLTASLFEEANNMVQDANIKRMQAEKLLKESNAKIEVLSAEVTALKTLVITSTPSMPNRHLHPQLEKGKKKAEGNGSDGGFIKGHRRSTSHHNFTKDISMVDMDVAPPTPPKDDREVDPVYFGEFSAWKERPNMVPDTPFLSRIINEDIKPCLNFTNKELSQRLHQSIVHNSLSVEPMPEKNPFPRKCALTEKTRICKYRIRLGDSEPWHYVSQAARNRITTVCDFYTYTRYITQGIVKSDERDQYWEIMRLRKQMNLSRLGIS